MHGIVWKARYIWHFCRLSGCYPGDVGIVWQHATASYEYYGHEHPAEVAADDISAWFGGV